MPSSYVQAAILALLTVSSSFAGLISTTHNSYLTNWNVAESWTNGIPDNGPANTYSATINGSILIPQNYSAVVDELHSAGGVLDMWSGSLRVMNVFDYQGGLISLDHTYASALLDIHAPNPAQTGTTLVNSCYMVGYPIYGGDPASDGRSSTMQWEGAQIETISDTAAIYLGRNSSIKDVSTGANALAGLSRVDGELHIVGGDYVLPSLQVGSSGEVSIANGNIVINGDYTAPDHIGREIKHYWDVNSLPVTNLSVGGGNIVIHGSNTGQVGFVLMTGSYATYTGGVIKWRGANVHTIGTDASITLGAGGKIVNELDDSNALAHLSKVQGTFILRRDLTTDANFSIESAAHMEMDAAGIVTAPNLDISSGATITMALAQGFQIDGVANLNGTLSLSGLRFEGPLTQDTVYVLIDAGSILGEFVNAPNGSRISIKFDGYIQIPGQTYAPPGSFEITYTDDQVLLSHYLASVPEPSTLILCLGGLGSILALRTANHRLRKQ